MDKPENAAPRVTLLEEAIRLTAGDRNKAYGDPVVNHQHIADVFNAITGRDLSARDVALVHVATKLARLAKNPLHRDSYVDGPAYLGIAYECAQAEDRRDTGPADCWVPTTTVDEERQEAADDLSASRREFPGRSDRSE